MLETLFILLPNWPSPYSSSIKCSHWLLNRNFMRLSQCSLQDFKIRNKSKCKSYGKKKNLLPLEVWNGQMQTCRLRWPIHMLCDTQLLQHSREDSNQNVKLKSIKITAIAPIFIWTNCDIFPTRVNFKPNITNN